MAGEDRSLTCLPEEAEGAGLVQPGDEQRWLQRHLTAAPNICEELIKKI